MLPILNQEQQTITTQKLHDLVNIARLNAGESAVSNTHFLGRVEDELEGELGDSKYFTHPQNHKKIRYYDLTLEQATLVGMRESKSVRRAVLAKLKELESQLQNPQPAPMPAIPQTLPEALRLAADLAEQNQAQKEQLALAAPKVEFVDKYVEGEGLRGFRQIAKLLGAKENEFRAFLAEQKIMYKLGGGWAAYGNHLDAGRFEAKEVTNNEQGKSYAQHLFTQKGVAWIAGEWAKHKIQHNLN